MLFSNFPASGCLLNTTNPDSANVPPKPGRSVQQSAKTPGKAAKKSNVGGQQREEPPFLVEVPAEVFDVDSTDRKSVV